MLLSWGFSFLTRGCRSLQEWLTVVLDTDPGQHLDTDLSSQPGVYLIKCRMHSGAPNNLLVELHCNQDFQSSHVGDNLTCPGCSLSPSRGSSCPPSWARRRSRRSRTGAPGPSPVWRRQKTTSPRPCRQRRRTRTTPCPASPAAPSSSPGSPRWRRSRSRRSSLRCASWVPSFPWQSRRAASPSDPHCQAGRTWVHCPVSPQSSPHLYFSAPWSVRPPQYLVRKRNKFWVKRWGQLWKVSGAEPGRSSRG